MSVGKVSNSDSNFGIGSKIATAAATGAVLGGGYMASTPRWLDKNVPSDTFIKNVSDSMKQDLPKTELLESVKINKFLKAATDPNTRAVDLKPMILDSKELSEAIKQNENETVEVAIERVFSQKDESKIKRDLLNLQYKTKSDKKANRNAATNLIFKNLDTKTKKLVKSEDTAERTFQMLKKSAAKVQANAIAKGALLTGVIAGAIGLMMVDVPDEK